MWPSGNGESPEKHQAQERITACFCFFLSLPKKYKHLSHCSILCLLSISGLLLRYWCTQCWYKKSKSTE